MTRITNLIELLRVDLVHSISPKIAWDYIRRPCKFGIPKLLFFHFLFGKFRNHEMFLMLTKYLSIKIFCTNCFNEVIVEFYGCLVCFARFV